MGNVYFELVKNQRESQKKYDYYFLAVILTLLTLSIQNYKPGDFVNYNYLIVVVWLLLLISFLIGMFRQERINIHLRNEAEKTWVSSELVGIEKSINNSEIIRKSTGEQWTSQGMHQERDKFKRLMDIANENISKSSKMALSAYGIQKWSFVISLILYAFLRIVNL